MYNVSERVGATFSSPTTFLVNFGVQCMIGTFASRLMSPVNASQMLHLLAGTQV